MLNSEHLLNFGDTGIEDITLMRGKNASFFESYNQPTAIVFETLNRFELTSKLFRHVFSKPKLLKLLIDLLSYHDHQCDNMAIRVKKKWSKKLDAEMLKNINHDLKSYSHRFSKSIGYKKLNDVINLFERAQDLQYSISEDRMDLFTQKSQLLEVIDKANAEKEGFLSGLFIRKQP